MPSSHPSNGGSGEAWLDEIFTYHAPSASQVERYAEVREWARRFASVIMDNCPECADRSAAIRKVREAVMTANAAIALET